MIEDYRVKKFKKFLLQGLLWKDSKRDSQIQQIERPLQNPTDYVPSKLNKFKNYLWLFIIIPCFCIKNREKRSSSDYASQKLYSLDQKIKDS